MYKVLCHTRKKEEGIEKMFGLKKWGIILMSLVLSLTLLNGCNNTSRAELKEQEKRMESRLCGGDCLSLRTIAS